MAARKLSLTLFSAKPEVRRGERTPQNFHFTSIVPNKPRQYARVCETQPLLTLKGEGFPDRCSFCGQGLTHGHKSPA